MIQNDEQLKSTQKALGHVERALASLRSRKASMHPTRFAVMAEGPIDEIWNLRRQIDEYLGVSFTVAECPYPEVKAEVK